MVAKRARSAGAGTTSTKKEAGNPVARKTAAKKSTATKQTAAKKSTAKKTAATESTAKRTAAKSTAKKTAATESTAKRTAAKSPAKRTAATESTAKRTATPRLVVRGDESPWTKRELTAVRREIEADIGQLRDELDVARHELVDLMRDSGDGAGDDQADAGAKTYEREQELALADNARVMRAQKKRALERLDDGSYGVCESCGQPIGKLRLQAAPRATLCLPCKAQQERR